MDYTLALELKNAGFPQNITYGDHFYYDSMPKKFVIMNMRQVALDEPITKRPTFEELIEECGEYFSFVARSYDRDTGFGDSWGAESTTNHVVTNCPSATKAVALLYIKINKKLC